MQTSFQKAITQLSQTTTTEKVILFYIALNSVIASHLMIDTTRSLSFSILTLVTVLLLTYILYIRFETSHHKKINKYIEFDDLTEKYKRKYLLELKRLEFNWLSFNKIILLISKANIFVAATISVFNIIGMMSNTTDEKLLQDMGFLGVQHVVISILLIIISTERNEFYTLKQSHLFNWILYRKRRQDLLK